MGRVVDRTPYPAEGRVSVTAYQFEAQIWDGRAYDPDGFVCRSFQEALEYLT